jgi:nucleoside-diphosphate kinase
MAYEIEIFYPSKSNLFYNYTSNPLTFAAKTIKIMSNRTFTMIKPDATSKGYTGAILDQIIKAGYTVKAMKWTKLTIEQAGLFYDIHRERPFFGELVQFMSSGPIVAAILEKENAVEDFRTLIGATNPANAAEGTIRKNFAASIGENAVHGSDSDENAQIEGDFFFSKLERF